jgi:G3E family GTPase
MPYPGHNLKIDKRTPGEERLTDYFWPADCIDAPPEHFRQSIALLKTVRHREAEIIVRLRGYLEFAQDPDVRNEIEAFIRTLEEKKPTKPKNTEKKK